jgi:drug/metabolite transporter (DMT)-like permease
VAIAQGLRIVLRLHQAPRTLLLTAAAMTAFAGNSLLCRAALRGGAIDPGLFTAVRIAAGIAVLVPLARGSGGARQHGSWGSALALAAYAVLFSFAYLALDASLGTLLLFGAVQTTMIGTGVARGERPSPRVWQGLLAAVAGLCVLLLPGAAGGSPGGALMMLGAGLAWGIYSLRGRGIRDPLAATAGNFARAVWLAAPVALLQSGGMHANASGLLLAAVSGALTSGLGYVAWYAALRGLTATQAAIAQLTVPVLAAALASLWLGERPSWSLVLAGALVLGGVGTAMTARR